LTGAYTFTNYRSQGQTIPNVIVDITTAPTRGQLTLFNTLHFARAYLQSEDSRLRELNAQTQQWWESICTYIRAMQCETDP
ncbi:hypothetical protein K439DRAFT_1329715, partial [Ramaria rubella]